jgi:hypothetical protein
MLQTCVFIPDIPYSGFGNSTPPPTFFCKSINPGELFLPLHKDVILKPLARAAFGMRYSCNLQVLEDLRFQGPAFRKGWFVASCVSRKSIIPGRLPLGPYKSIILRALVRAAWSLYKRYKRRSSPRPMLVAEGQTRNGNLKSQISDREKADPPVSGVLWSPPESRHRTSPPSKLRPGSG